MSQRRSTSWPRTFALAMFGSIASLIAIGAVTWIVWTDLVGVHHRLGTNHRAVACLIIAGGLGGVAGIVLAGLDALKVALAIAATLSLSPLAHLGSRGDSWEELRALWQLMRKGPGGSDSEAIRRRLTEVEAEAAKQTADARKEIDALRHEMNRQRHIVEQEHERVEKLEADLESRKNALEKYEQLANALSGIGARPGRIVAGITLGGLGGLGVIAGSILSLVSG